MFGVAGGGYPEGGEGRGGATRTVNDNNGHSYQWTYSYGTVVNHLISNTVTDPLGKYSVHTFTDVDGVCAFYETRTQIYQGTGTARQMLKQVETAYYTIGLSLETGEAPGLGVVPTSVRTTIYPSGRVSLVQKTYAPPIFPGGPISGQVATEKVYDWGEDNPGPLLKETDTTYQGQIKSASLTANRLDLPAAVVVKDPGGNRVAETDYIYDESAYLTSANVTTQHVSPPNAVRGNLTTVKHWLNTNNSWITSHTNWYDTGEPYQEIDPLGNTTTHSYSSTFIATYPTKSRNALRQCVTPAYACPPGVLTNF